MPRTMSGMSARAKSKGALSVDSSRVFGDKRYFLAGRADTISEAAMIKNFEKRKGKKVRIVKLTHDYALYSRWN